jgi:hypothetical protein
MANYRSESIKKVAYELSLDYQEQDENRLLPFLEDFKLFRRGRRKKIRNLMSYRHPMLEFQAHIFDYRFKIGAGNTTRYYHQTVFFIRSKKLGLPAFFLRPESLFHKFGEFLQLRKDIDFEAFPDFSKQYELNGNDEDYIRATMNDQVLHFFTVNKNWTLEGVNYYLIFYKKNRIIPASKIKDFYQKGLHLANILEAEDLGI